MVDDGVVVRRGLRFALVPHKRLALPHLFHQRQDLLDPLPAFANEADRRLLQLGEGGAISDSGVTGALDGKGFARFQ